MKHIIKGIINLWNWLPIVWKDADYDHHYIEVMLHQKLRNTYDFFTSENAVTNWDEQEASKALRALQICITILERRQNNFYLMMCSTICSKEEIDNITKCEQRDMELFGKLFGKYLNYWWD